MPILPTDDADRAELGSPDYERVVHALSYVESHHDPCAISPSGTYVGRWQMGPPAASDVGIDDVSVLRCNSDLARWALDSYLAKYARWHRWEPRMIALTWKAGPGTAREVRELRDAGRSFEAALREADRPESPRGELPHRTLEYLALFDDAMRPGTTSHPAVPRGGAYVL